MVFMWEKMYNKQYQIILKLNICCTKQNRSAINFDKKKNLSTQI